MDSGLSDTRTDGFEADDIQVIIVCDEYAHPNSFLFRTNINRVEDASSGILSKEAHKAFKLWISITIPSSLRLVDGNTERAS